MKKLLSVILSITILLSFSIPVFATNDNYEKEANYRILSKKNDKSINSKSVDFEKTLKYDLKVKENGNKNDVKFKGVLLYNNQEIKFDIRDANVREYDAQDGKFYIIDADDTYVIDKLEIPVTYYIEKYNDEEYVAITIGEFGSEDFSVIVSNEPIISNEERKLIISDNIPSTNNDQVSIMADFIREDYDYASDSYSNGYTHKMELYLETDIYDNEDGSAVARIYTYTDNVEDGLLDYYMAVNDVQAYRVTTEFELVDDESWFDGYYPDESASSSEWVDYVCAVLSDLDVPNVYTTVFENIVESFGNDISVSTNSYNTYCKITQYPYDDELMDLDDDGEGLPYKVEIDKDTNSTDDDFSVDTVIRFYSMVYDDEMGTDYPFLFNDNGTSISVDLSSF